MNDKNKIIYELLFSEEEEFIFEISSLFEFIEDYKEVLDEIVKNISKGRVKIIKDVIEVKGDNIFWNIKINRI
jgi:hypothetical protein